MNFDQKKIHLDKIVSSLAPTTGRLIDLYRYLKKEDPGSNVDVRDLIGYAFSNLSNHSKITQDIINYRFEMCTAQDQSRVSRNVYPNRFYTLQACWWSIATRFANDSCRLGPANKDSVVCDLVNLHVVAPNEPWMTFFQNEMKKIRYEDFQRLLYNIEAYTRLS